MITVCIAAFNGEKYIGEQLQSILASSLVDEVIVSDDGSKDRTVDVVASYKDERVSVVEGPGMGLIKNYEYLFSLATGDYVFLADQDDVWFPNKVEVMLDYLQDADLVVCDCTVVDAQLNRLQPSFFQSRHSGPGVFRNVWRNSYLGCCMAFRRELLRHALPFPDKIPMHDMWLGLIAELYGKTVFIDQLLMMYRRHGSNASITSEISRTPFGKRLVWRLNLLKALIRRKLNLG